MPTSCTHIIKNDEHVYRKVLRDLQKNVSQRNQALMFSFFSYKKTKEKHKIATLNLISVHLPFFKLESKPSKLEYSSLCISWTVEGFLHICNLCSNLERKQERECKGIRKRILD